jgi:hypothetical protein
MSWHGGINIISALYHNLQLVLTIFMRRKLLEFWHIIGKAQELLYYSCALQCATIRFVTLDGLLGFEVAIVSVLLGLCWHGQETLCCALHIF